MENLNADLALVVKNRKYGRMVFPIEKGGGVYDRVAARYSRR